jgi:hypothetical protein
MTRTVRCGVRGPATCARCPSAQARRPATLVVGAPGGQGGHGPGRIRAGSTIAAFTIVLSSRRTGYVLDGMSWVMKTTHTSSTGSTQKVVDAMPPHENSPGDAATP